MIAADRQTHLAITAIPLIFSTFLIWGCGDPPTTAVEQRGSIEVRGMMTDSTLADSIHITLDDTFLGSFPNPHICENILAGTHLVEVGSIDVQSDTVVEYWSTPQLVEVLPNATTLTEFTLVTEAPYVGNIAPDFDLRDLDSNLVSLSGSAGEVVLLYFFTAT